MKSIVETDIMYQNKSFPVAKSKPVKIQSRKKIQYITEFVSAFVMGKFVKWCVFVRVGVCICM